MTRDLSYRPTRIVIPARPAGGLSERSESKDLSAIRPTLLAAGKLRQTGEVRFPHPGRNIFSGLI